MNRYEPPEALTCKQAREQLDGAVDPHVAPLGVESLSFHLARCPACREYKAHRDALATCLRSLPEIPFPDERLKALFAQTVDAAPVPVSRRPLTSRSRRWAMAAAVLLAVAIPLAARHVRASRQARIDRAIIQTRYVLGVTAGAFRRAESAAVEDVLELRLPEALKRFPLDWTRKPFSFIRRLGT